MLQLFVVEQPCRCGNDVGLVPVYFVDNHSYVFIDGGRYDFPFYGIVLCYLCVQCRECQRRVCIRAIEVYPENFHIWLNFIFAKITDFAFRINKKGYICMSEIENSRVIGIECFLKDEIFFLYSYFYKVITGCLITGLIK